MCVYVCVFERKRKYIGVHDVFLILVHVLPELIKAEGLITPILHPTTISLFQTTHFNNICTHFYSYPKMDLRYFSLSSKMFHFVHMHSIFFYHYVFIFFFLIQTILQCNFFVAAAAASAVRKGHLKQQICSPLPHITKRVTVHMGLHIQF